MSFLWHVWAYLQRQGEQLGHLGGFQSVPALNVTTSIICTRGSGISPGKGLQVQACGGHGVQLNSAQSRFGYILLWTHHPLNGPRRFSAWSWFSDIAFQNLFVANGEGAWAGAWRWEILTTYIRTNLNESSSSGTSFLERGWTLVALVERWWSILQSTWFTACTLPHSPGKVPMYNWDFSWWMRVASLLGLFWQYRQAILTMGLLGPILSHEIWLKTY